MNKEETPGFFERLTGARIMSREKTVNHEHEFADDVSGEEVAGGEGQEVSEAVEEKDNAPEEEFSDENKGVAEGDEHEGQLTVDVFQDDANVVIQSTIAGVSPDDLDVSITNDMVTIRGERQRMQQVGEEDYFYQECYWGTFSRSVILPVEIDADRAEAKIRNGILTIRIPKANAAMTRKLKVRAS